MFTNNIKINKIKQETKEFPYLTVSAEPLSPPTVEKRIASGVFFPTWEKTFAIEYLEMSLVTSKYPKAPEKQGETKLERE